MRFGASKVIALWEAGRNHRAARRALAMLESAYPERDAAELARLPLGQRDTLLLSARQRMIGEALVAVTDCPACSEKVEARLSCTSLMSAQPALEFDETLTVDGYELLLRLPGSADLVAIENCRSVAEATALLAARCIRRASFGGAVVATDTLPREVVSTVASTLAAGDPGAETLFALSCPCCNERWSSELDIAAFFWKEVHAHAVRLMDDVHVLAGAYGWSESAILGMSGARRDWYLERVLA